MTPYIVLILVPLALLAVFLLIVAYEGRVGRRIALAGRRHLLDRKVERAVFVVKHVDWGAFANDIARTGLEKLVHDIAHTTLVLVRMLERQLTVLVRTLRARRDQPLFPVRSAEKPSRLESAVAYLKKTVHRSQKEPVRPQIEGRADEEQM